MADNKKYWSNPPDQSVKASISSQLNGTSLVDSNPNKMQRKHQPQQSNSDRRSLNHLPSSESAQSYSTGNQSVNYIKMTNNNRNSIETFHSLNDGNKNYISNSRMNIISSAPLGTSHGSRNCSRNGSRYNLVEAQNANSGTNSYYSYDQYVAQKCTQNKKSESPDAYYEITHANIEKFNQVKDEDKNIDNSKWLEEKPISVLQLDQPDRAVLKIADQRDKIQKKTFTKWINKYLTKQTVKISDLFEDLRDGVCLISLLKALSNTEIPKEKGTTRFHALQNVHRCLDFLEEHNIKLVNIRPDEIVDGNPKLTLGLIWIIILNFQISDIVGKDVIARDALLSWANKHLQPVSIFVQDFSHSWKDGKAFLGILLRHIPEKLNWEQTKFQSNKQRLQLAFTLAEQEFSVTKLLDPEDVDVPQPDERSIITYVSSLYEGLPALKTQQQIEKEKERRGLVQEYSMLFKILSRWLNQSIESINSKYQLPSGFVELKSLIADLKCFRLEEHAVKLKEKKKLASIYVELESYYSKNFPQMVGPDEDIRLVEKLWERLDLAVQTRESELEQAILRSERMQTKYESFVANTSRIDSDLEMLKSQLDLCLRRFNDQNRNKKSVSDELKAHLDRLESQVHVKEQDLRKALIDALQLEEENYPNSSVLIEGLKRTQQTTTALLVTITNAKTSQPNQFLTNLISTNAQYHAQLCETKKLSIISPPNSILDKSSSSNLSTPSQSISTTSSSIQSSNETNNNSIPTTQQILKSSNRLKTTTQYLEITSNATPILPGARPNKQSSPIEHYSPSSINTSCCANVSNNLSKSISLLQKSSSQELLSISDSEIIDLINEAFKWIRIKQAFLDNTKFKPDLCQLQLDLELLYQLKNELAHYRTNIETIELLKMRHVETAELTGLVNQLNFEYRSLCMSAKSVKNNLELLLEYVKLVHEELHFINQMEDVELNRDWSVPAKLNYSELREHRKQVETSLANRQMNYTRILAMAESLVDAKHPAAQDINAYVSALRTGKVWLLELMSILGVHMTYLKVYNKFTKEHNRLDAELTQTGEKFNLLKNSTAYNLSTWNDSLREDFTNQFAQFKRAFQSSKYPEQLDEISALIDKMPSYKLRRSQLKAPFNTAKILTKYSQVEFTIAKDEACRIEDNSDLLKWKVMSLEKNRQAEVPSVCFIIKGPDADLVDLIEKLRFKCNQMDIDIEKFDANLKREKVSKIMQEILNDSKKSSKLQCLSRANIENLIDTVRDEVSSIVNSQRSNEEFSRLLSEFNDFNQSLRQILNMSAGFESTLDQNEELIAMSYFNSLRTSSRPFGSVEQLQTNLDRLYEQFAIIVADVFILHTMTNANNHSIRKNFCLESKFQQFQQTDFRGFEKDLKYAEKLAGSVNNSTSNLSSGFHNSSESPSTGSPEPGLELKSKVTHVKSKYQNLIHLSNLYSKSFSNLDSLSKIVDEFIGDMCQIEIKLASQSLIENVNIDADLIRKEHESLQEVKGLFKAHENDLMVMKSYYEELKTSLEKVRTRNFDQDKFSLSSAEDSPRQKRTDERQSEDLLKLDLLIKQLTDRWNHSLHFYRTRRNNLKDCQRAFEEYQTTVRLEKEYLSSINGEEEEPQVKALERKQSVETCNQKAAQFVQLAKPKQPQPVAKPEPPQLPTLPKPDELEAKTLYDNVRQILENLTEFEFELARQSPLPDTQDSLAKQRADFNQFATRVTEKALFFNGVIDKTKEFSSNPKNETSRLKTDLINYSNEAAYRLKMISTEIEKRQLSLESASIHLAGISNDQTKFQEWFTQAEASFNKLKVEYKDTAVHDLPSLERFEAEARALEIVLFSHQDDIQFQNQHLKAYATTTDHFSNDLKNFCVKLKNNRVKRLSGEMLSDLETLKHNLQQCEVGIQTMSKQLDTFKAKLVQCIASHAKFNNSCMRLDLWLNEFEPKLKKIASDNDNGNVRKLEDAYKRIQSLQSDVHNKRSELDDIRTNLNEVAAQIDPANYDLTMRSLQAKANVLISRYEEAVGTAQAQGEVMLHKLTIVRNMKENVDSTSQWLAELNHTYLNEHSHEQSEEDYERIKADLMSRRDILVKSLSNDSSQNKQLEQLLAKIDSVSKQMEQKAGSQKSLQLKLQAFHSECDRLSAFYATSQAMLSSIDVIHGRVGDESSVSRADCIQRVEALSVRVDSVEKPKIEELNQMLTDAKYKFWPDVLTDMKLKSLQMNVIELEERLGQLASAAQVKIAELQHVHDHSEKWSAIMTGFEGYVNATEGQVLAFEPIAIDIEIVAKQLEQLQSMQKEYEVKSHDLSKMVSFGHQYLGVIAKFTRHQASDSNADDVVTRDLAKLTALYKWLGERFGERKADLAQSLETMKSYLQEMAHAEFKLNEWEHQVLSLFDVEADRMKLKLPVELEALKKLATDSQKLMQANSVSADADLEKLKEKQFLFDRLTNDKNGLEDVKNQLTDLTGKFQDLRTFHEDLNQKLVKFQGTLGNYEQTYSNLKNNLEAKQNQLNVIIGDRASMSIDAELLEQDVQTVKAITDELVPLDSELAALNKLGTYVSENGRDKFLLDTQLAQINEKFEAINNDAKITLKVKLELQRLCADFNQKKEEFIGKLSQIDAKLKQLSNPDLLANATEDSAKSIVAELADLEHSQFHECNQTLDAIKVSYNDLYDVAREFLVANGCDSQDMEVTVNLEQTPAKLLGNLESTQTVLQRLKSDFGELLNADKAFDRLLTDLNQFINTKLDQLEQDKGRLSTQQDKLSIKSVAHENSFMCELNRRSEDFGKLVSFHRAKLEELTDQEEMDNTKALIRDLEASWAQLKEQCDVRKEQINACINLSEQFSTDRQLFVTFMEQCENEKSGIVAFDAPNLAELFGTKINKSKELLNNVADSKTLDKCQQSGSELIGACDLDLDVVESQLKEAESRSEALVLDLNEIALVSEKGQADLANFDAKCDEVDANIVQLKKDMAKASATTASKSLSALEEVKSKVAEVPEQIDECKDLAKCLGDKTGNVTDKLNRLDGDYQELDEQIASKVKEATDKMADLREFEANLAKMDEKLSKIQETLDLKQPSSESEPTKPDVIDEASLKAKQVHLDELKESLSGLNDQLKLAEDSLAKASAEDAIELQKSIRILTARSSQLNELQQKEEKEIHEQTELLQSLTSRIVKCNEDIGVCGKSFDSMVSTQKPVESPLTTRATINGIVGEHEAYESEYLAPIKTEVTAINQESASKFNVDVSKPSDLIMSPVNIQSMDVIQMTSLELKLEKLNYSFNKLDTKFKDRAKQLDLALFKSATFEDKLDVLNGHLMDSEERLQSLSKVLFDFSNLNEIDVHLGECDELTASLSLASEEIDEFKEICEKLMQNCDSAEDRDIIEKRMDALIYKWNMQTLQLVEKQANLTFLNCHLKELNESYLSAKAFTEELNLKFTSELVLNCIEPIVMKSTQEKMRDANEVLLQKFEAISELKVDTNNLLAIYEDYEHVRTSQESKDSGNKLIAQLPKTISSTQVFALACMLNKPDIEAYVHEIDFKYSDYKFHLGKNLDLMQRLYPLCEKFTQKMALLNQSFAKLDSELEWLTATNANETNQKDKETLFTDLQSIMGQNNDTIEDLERRLSTKIVDELNATPSTKCDEFIEDLDTNIAQVKDKYTRCAEKLAEYAALFEEKKLKVRELFAEMDDLLEWLDDIDAKYTAVEPISHEPEVIKIQLTEQKNLNYETQSQADKLKEITELSKNLIRAKYVEDSIELKEKLTGLQLQSGNLTRQGVARLNELEHALAIAESFYESHKVLEAWFDEVKEELANVDRHHLKETAAGEPKEAIKLELSLLKQVERSLQEKKADFEAMNKNGSALIRLCDKNNGKQQQQEASSIVNKEHQSAVQLRESIQYSNERYDKLKTVVGRRKEELETLLWKSAEFAEKVDDVTSQLNACVELFEYAEPISAHADKLRVQVEDNRLVQADLDKRKQALDDLRDEAINNAADVGRQLFKNNDMLSSITSAASDDGHEAAANAGSLVDQENVEKRIGELDELWYQLKELSEVRASALDEAVRCADTFWSDFHSFMDVVADLEDRLKQVENETVAMDPDSVIEQQQHQEDIIREIDEHEASVQEFRETGAKLMELCGQSDQAEVDKTCEELELAWSRIKQQVRDREIELQQTFGKACEFQQELIEILEWISLQQEKFINLDSSFTSTDPKTIRFQINLLKEFKEQIDPEQLKIELLNQKFDELKMSTRTNQSFDVLASLQEPLNSANKEWKRLQSGIVERKASLQNALLDMGQFNEALDEMLKWVERTDQSLEDMHQTSGSECELITNSRLVSGVDVQLAKLKVLKNDINAQEQSVSKLKETGKNLIRNETTGKQSLQEIKQRVQLLIDSWENLLLKLQEKQSTLQGQLAESRTYACELQDALHWLADTESQLNVNKPTGGLPETAREQLDKFQQLYENIQTNTPTIEALIATGGTLLADNGTTDSSKMTTSQSIVQTVEKVATKWLAVQRKATERLSRLETASRDAQEFHAQLQKFIGWLTETEKELNMNRPVSKLLANINNQIGEHQSLQKNITEHRARMIALDTLGYQLKYHSQKQDVILVKNVLISVQNRWEKIVSRSAERTRDLERGYKESKLFTDNWSELTVWLSEHLDLLNKEQEITVGNNPLKIKQCIAKNKEFHRELSAKQAAYDVVMRLGRKLVDKCEGDAVDKSQLQELLNEAKNKWQSVCFQSTERQKRLEDALLCSGQFREALQSLIEWLGRVEPTLAENTQLNGDLESVLALIEDNQQFQQQLQYKADQVRVVRKAATELLLTSSSQEGAATEDTESLQEQLEEMNELWNRVDEYSRDRTERLDRALKLAKEFNGQVRARLEWLSSAEQLLKFSPPISTDNEQEIIEQIEQHQNFVRDFKDQESLVQQCLNLGQELLDTCTPEAVLNLRHSIAVVQSRFDEINQLSEHKCKRLSDSLSMCKENEELLGELLVWVQGAEATLTAADQVKIVSNLDLIEQLLSDHQEFQTEMQSRQVLVERITKSSVVKDLPDQFDSMKKKSTSIRSLNKGSSNSGWRTPEPRIKNPRVTTLFNRWRKVWLMCMDRQRKLKEALDRQRELERLKNFSFDDWRRRYMNWHKDNRARITDFFRRQDRDHDGKISREEFIEGILSSNFPSSRLELEAVADRFDVDKDGYIDYKEFLATLKPTSNIEPNFERIRDEVQRQVSLCKCSKRYHVLQISDRQYRFGDSQKLRLVRILQSTVMVRVGGGWMALDEFLVKNDPCRAKGRTNIDLQSSLLLKEITHQHSLDGIYQQKSPGRFVTSMSHHASACAHSNSNNQLKTPTSQRSGASSSNSNSKRNLRSDSLSQSNEVLILAASMPSEANSQSGSLGASISDLSSEPTSEFSDGNYSVTNKSSKNGTSTPNGSRLPVFNKKTGVVPANK